MTLDLTKYLEKLKTTKLPDSEIKDVIFSVFKEIFKLDINRNLISYSRGIVKINGSSAMRSEIVMKQEKIIARIKELNPDLKITKIM